MEFHHPRARIGTNHQLSILGIYAMQIIEKIVDRTYLFHLLTKGDTEHPSAPFISNSLHSHTYCYLALIDLEEYKHLVINSSIEQVQLDVSDYPLINDVISKINSHTDFLYETRSDGGLNGIEVQRKLSTFEQEGIFSGALIQDKYPSMRDTGSYYVIDGMHRLVAYGLLTRLDSKHFPIKVYLCTNNPDI